MKAMYHKQHGTEDLCQTIQGKKDKKLFWVGPQAFSPWKANPTDVATKAALKQLMTQNTATELAQPFTILT